MVAEEAFTAAVLVVAGSVTAAEDIVEADLTAARGLLAEEVTTEVEAFVADQGPVITERAAVCTAGSVHRAA
jgi:hypothetical protein